MPCVSVVLIIDGRKKTSPICFQFASVAARTPMISRTAYCAIRMRCALRRGLSLRRGAAAVASLIYLLTLPGTVPNHFW